LESNRKCGGEGKIGKGHWKSGGEEEQKNSYKGQQKKIRARTESKENYLLKFMDM
jgi:hypothetical protein